MDLMNYSLDNIKTQIVDTERLLYMIGNHILMSNAFKERLQMLYEARDQKIKEMKGKQTAVDYLIEEIHKNIEFIPVNLQEQAKEIEKDRLYHSFYAGGSVTDNEDFEEKFKQYYNETYGK